MNCIPGYISCTNILKGHERIGFKKNIDFFFYPIQTEGHPAAELFKFRFVLLFPTVQKVLTSFFIKLITKLDFWTTLQWNLYILTFKWDPLTYFLLYLYFTFDYLWFTLKLCVIWYRLSLYGIYITLNLFYYLLVTMSNIRDIFKNKKFYILWLIHS